MCLDIRQMKNHAVWKVHCSILMSSISTCRNPLPTDVQLEEAARRIEDGVERRFRSRNTKVRVPFQQDIYRFLFGVEKSYIVETFEILEQKLDLRPGWNIQAKKSSQFVKVCLPFRVTYGVRMKSIKTLKNGNISEGTFRNGKLNGYGIRIY